MVEQQQFNFFDRELSWLEFNMRVLNEAMDSKNPVLERLKFMGIVSSNLDEFFMVRVASLNSSTERKPVNERVQRLVDLQNDYFVHVLIPELEQSDMRHVGFQGLTEEQKHYVKHLFVSEILPLLTPISLPSERPMPLLANLTLYFAVMLQKRENDSEMQHAIVAMPKSFPRIITLPSESGFRFLLIEDLVMQFADQLFEGYKILDQGLFRVTRAADLSIDEERDDDLAALMTEALSRRRKNEVIRLELAGSERIRQWIRSCFNVEDSAVYLVPAWFDLKSISQISFQPAFEHLKNPSWVPGRVPEFDDSDDLWALLRDREILVHHPYETYDTVVRFINEAAWDQDVLAIKITLYRANKNSMIISSLVEAVENGKDVTAIVELKARFDEENNIQWAQYLEDAGATVLYGVSGLKTHAKACLVIRREPDGIRKYVHLGTGNYNEKTASLYSDLSLFSSDEPLTNDVSAFFNIITGYSYPVGFSRLTMAPFDLRRKLKALIQRETVRCRTEGKGLIIAKMNSLVDEDIIRALYEASRAGVEIKLNVRGICRLVPEVPDMSSHIRVVSIVGKFLEHSRIFYFGNGDAPEVYLSSADWMPRNLDRRVELLFPVENQKAKKTLIDILHAYFKDNTNAWGLKPDGTYLRKTADQEKSFSVQEYFCKRAAERSTQLKGILGAELKPHRPK